MDYSMIEEGAIVTYTPYRKKRVSGICLRLPISEEMKVLEAKLAEAAGANIQPHIAYHVRRGNGSIFVMFSDDKVIFGTSLSDW